MYKGEEYSSIPEQNKELYGAASNPVIASAVKQMNTTGSVKDRQLKKHAGLHLRQDILHGRNRIIVPLATRVAVMDLSHNSFHGGLYRTYGELWKGFYWKGMYSDTVSTCETCRISLENIRIGTQSSTNTYQDLIPIPKSPTLHPSLVKRQLQYVLIVVYRGNSNAGPRSEYRPCGPR